MNRRCRWLGFPSEMTAGSCSTSWRGHFALWVREIPETLSIDENDVLVGATVACTHGFLDIGACFLVANVRNFPCMPAGHDHWVGAFRVYYPRGVSLSVEPARMVGSSSTATAREVPNQYQNTFVSNCEEFSERDIGWGASGGDVRVPSVCRWKVE